VRPADGLNDPGEIHFRRLSGLARDRLAKGPIAVFWPVEIFSKSVAFCCILLHATAPIIVGAEHRESRLCRCKYLRTNGIVSTR